MANAAMFAVPGFQMITSGYRPGDDGYHGVAPPWNAVDVGGTNLLGIAQYFAAQFGGNMRELIHTPLGFGIKNGNRVPLSFWGPAVNADHYDHVHAAKYGWHGQVNKPSLFLAGEAGSERVDITPGVALDKARERRPVMVNITVNGAVTVPEFDKLVVSSVERAVYRLGGAGL